MDYEGELNELATALAKAQANIAAAKKDGTNPHFRSKFATIESVIDVIRKPLYENGLSFVQLPCHHESGIGLTTTLMHSSGQWISSTMVLPIDMQKGRTDVQAAGSTIAYMRRYALLALLGIPCEDTDGNDTQAPGRPAARAGASDDRPPPQPGFRATEKQAKMFFALTRRLGMNDDDRHAGLSERGVDAFEELDRKTASEILDALKARCDELDAEGGR